MRSAALLACVVLGCKSPPKNEVRPEPAKVVPSASTVAATHSSGPASGSASTAPPPSAAPSLPLPTPPIATCPLHPDLVWDPDPLHPLLADMETAPRTLVVAPATKLILPHVAALETAGDAGADEPDETAKLALQYHALGLPKTATIDASSGEIIWRVDAASGDAVAITVVATATADPKKRCAVTSMIIRVLDDDTRRLQQAKWIARELWDERANLVAQAAARAKESEDPDAGDEALSETRAHAHRNARFGGELVDLDGDGAKDAHLTFRPAYDHDYGVSLVLVRRKDTFLPLNRIGQASVDQAADGTKLLVSRGGCCCHVDLSIHRVFPNRVQGLVSEDVEGDCQERKAGIDLDRVATGISGYATWSSVNGVEKGRTQWKWNGKGFVVGKP